MTAPTGEYGEAVLGAKRLHCNTTSLIGANTMSSLPTYISWREAVGDIAPDADIDDALDSARWIHHLMQRTEEAVLTCEDVDNHVYWVQAGRARITVTYWCGDDVCDIGLAWDAYALGEHGNRLVADGHWLYGDRAAAGREIERILTAVHSQLIS